MKLKTVKFVRQVGPPGPHAANAVDRWSLGREFDDASSQEHFVRFTRTVNGKLYTTMIPYAGIQFAESVPVEVKKAK